MACSSSTSGACAEGLVEDGDGREEGCEEEGFRALCFAEVGFVTEF